MTIAVNVTKQLSKAPMRLKRTTKLKGKGYPGSKKSRGKEELMKLKTRVKSGRLAANHNAIVR